MIKKKTNSSRLMLNSLTKLMKDLTGKISMQQVLFHFSRGVRPVLRFLVSVKPWAI